MTAFDIGNSIDKALKRFGESSRRVRADRGKLRVDPGVVEIVERALGGRERPSMRRLLEEVGEGCEAVGLGRPSRSTVYKIMSGAKGRRYLVSELPEAVRAALYNLVEESVVPGRQVAFYCFNYGDVEAISFAAGLPWLALYQAGRMPGHRRKSRGLLQAVARVRGIEDGRAGSGGGDS